MKKISELYPIGTVVKLKNVEKRMMIYGILQMEENAENERRYDYAGVLYPEGNLSGDVSFLFDHEDIEIVFFLGYRDLEQQIFMSELEKNEAEAGGEEQSDHDA